MALPANKMVHQRNKSTSALSGVFHNGTAKNNAPRRAAFGDVSNTANPVHGSRDDTSLAGKKQITKGTEKPAAKGPEKRSTVLGQPPQRPGSMTGSKGILTNITQPNAQPKHLEPAGRQLTLPQQTANTRRTLNKRGTAVFKDPPQPVNETKEENIITSKEINNPDALDVSKDGSSRPKTALSLEESGKEAVVVQKPVKVHSYDTDNCSVVKPDDIDTEEETLSTADEDECKLQDPKKPNNHEPHGPAASESKYPELAPAPASSAFDQEPEEFWDEDEDEENEEDDGYVTARSYHSRGDNTTGGTTTMLFPKYSQQVRRELALAKQIVEATRPVEDIEDEFWDTSMVAEYSEEIFDYMKEQEVMLLVTCLMDHANMS